MERERSVLRDQALQSGKPAEIVEKMLDGRLKKFYAESVLLQQAFVVDDSMSVGQAIAAVAVSEKAEVAISGFKRWSVGSGD